jgi:hypothetical protein
MITSGEFWEMWKEPARFFLCKSRRIYLYAFLWFFNEAFSSSDKAASNDRMVTEQWLGRDVERKGRDLISDNITAFASKE